MNTGEYKLIATPRNPETKADQIRSEGLVPAVIYGKHIDPQTIALDGVEFNRIFHKAGGSSLIDIEIAGQTPHVALFKEAQHDPRTGAILHIDLYAVSMTEKIRAEIPLVFENESPAVESHEAILVTNKDALEVECLPRDLPPSIQVDLSVLANIDDQITVGQIKVPAGVEVLNDAEEIVVLVAPHREEEEQPEVSEAEAVAAVEATAEKPAENSAE